MRSYNYYVPPKDKSTTAMVSIKDENGTSYGRKPMRASPAFCRALAIRLKKKVYTFDDHGNKIFEFAP